MKLERTETGWLGPVAMESIPDFILSTMKLQRRVLSIESGTREGE